MVEKTFAGAAAKQAAFALDSTIIGDEFSIIGSDIFESEQLSNELYESFILFMKDGFGGSQIDDIGNALSSTYYLPCTKRTVLRGQVDLTNDILPDRCAMVGREPHTAKLSAICCRKLDRLPRSHAAVSVGTHMAVTSLYESVSDRVDRKIIGREKLDSFTTYITVKDDGEIVPALMLCNRGVGRTASARAAMCQASAVCINGVADSEHLWNVHTSEPIFADFRLNISIGCNYEHVKSLFYARSLPTTKTGRKRPILHWVSAHRRRIERGIEIDITRHLRGVETFEMDSLTFSINNPKKKGMITRTLPT